MGVLAALTCYCPAFAMGNTCAAHEERNRTKSGTLLAEGDVAVEPSGFTIVLEEAQNVPRLDIGSDSDPYVRFEVWQDRPLGKMSMCSVTGMSALAQTQGRMLVASGLSSAVQDDSNPVWKELINLPQDPEDQEELDLTGAISMPPEDWDLETATVRIILYDQDFGPLTDDVAGMCEVPLKELISKSYQEFYMVNEYADVVLGSDIPHMPCTLALSVNGEWMPDDWPKPPSYKKSLKVAASFPYHVFMMTRGTRGDVQPFVALARGMAQQLGWLVTICTETRWKSFVEENANVSKGAIRFVTSGGDTEARMNTWTAQNALQSKTEFIQMMILSMSEAAFFSSGTVFVDHVRRMEKEPKPVDLVVFGLTVAGLAAMVSEICHKPIVGFILQPSCIPSEEESWTAIQPISTHGANILDRLEEMAFTSHNTLALAKAFAEHNPFADYNIDQIRAWFDLGAADTWEAVQENRVPLVIPMREGCFERPTDWPEEVAMTDFIFLRKDSPAQNKRHSTDDPQIPVAPKLLGEPLDSFIANARNSRAKIGLMTFSSMPVLRKRTLECSVAMVSGCPFNFRLIYAGKKQEDVIPPDLAAVHAQLVAQGRFLEVEKADFGVLFKHIDAFIVHGGLGTTVEALRMKKPCVITGPLLLDQRFWGTVCAQKGVGPEAVHIDDFLQVCVGFVNDALDPRDPKGYQANARAMDWGAESEDGVLANVEWFRQHMENDPKHVHTAPLAARSYFSCCSTGQERSCSVTDDEWEYSGDYPEEDEDYDPASPGPRAPLVGKKNYQRV